jgi:hypothetical protein
MSSRVTLSDNNWSRRKKREQHVFHGGRRTCEQQSKLKHTVCTAVQYSTAEQVQQMTQTQPRSGWGAASSLLHKNFTMVYAYRLLYLLTNKGAQT